MRVLAMLRLYLPHHCAGAELAAHGLLRALVAQGHTVDVLLSQPVAAVAAPYAVDGVRVHPRVDKADPARWLGSAAPPHVVVTHLENTDRASILGGMFRIPVVHLLHNDMQQTRRALLRAPALAVANTQWMADEIAGWWSAEHAGRPQPRTTVIHPPVDAEEYRTTPGAHVTLINVSEAKGAAVFYGLAERFPRTKFLAVEGAYGVQDRRSLPNVTWCRHVPADRMRDRVYRRTRVLLMPSVYESYGRCGVEAACSGIPTIAHPTPGLRESLGGAGIFADRGDTDAWAAHLRRLLRPAGWQAASALSAARAGELDTDADLKRWVSEVEGVAREPARHR